MLYVRTKLSWTTCSSSLLGKRSLRRLNFSKQRGPKGKHFPNPEFFWKHLNLAEGSVSIQAWFKVHKSFQHQKKATIEKVAKRGCTRRVFNHCIRWWRAYGMFEDLKLLNGMWFHRFSVEIAFIYWTASERRVLGITDTAGWLMRRGWKGWDAWWMGWNRKFRDSRDVRRVEWAWPYNAQRMEGKTPMKPKTHW